MTTANTLIGAGMSPLQAQTIGGTLVGGLTATGTTLATALPVPSDFAIVTTTPASAGVRLPADSSGQITPGDMYIVVNLGANILSSYPGTSAGRIGVSAIGAALSVQVNRTVIYFYLGSDNWGCQA